MTQGDIDMLAILARMEARGRGEKVDPPRPADTRVVPLPIWPDGFRGIPNGILRSALFGAIKRGARTFQNNEPKAAVKGLSIKYTGQQLDQSDLDVWEYCLHVCRRRGLGVRVEFLTYQCLREIKRSCGGSSADWLRSVLNRLSTAVVSVEDGQFYHSGALISVYSYDKETKLNTVVLNQKLISMYHAGWTQIEWEQRSKLRKHPLAQWLHGFYCTHAEPFPMKVATIHRLSGSENEKMYSFKVGLKRALAQLNSELGWECHIDEKGLVHVSHPLTASQARHIHNSGNAYSRE